MQSQESGEVYILKAEHLKKNTEIRGEEDDRVVHLPSWSRSFNAVAMRYLPDVSRVIL